MVPQDRATPWLGNEKDAITTTTTISETVSSSSAHTHTHTLLSLVPPRRTLHPRLASRGDTLLVPAPTCIWCLLLPLGLHLCDACLLACMYVRKCVLFCTHACIMHAWMVSTFDRRTLTDFNQASVVLLCNGPADIYNCNIRSMWIS